MFCLKRHGEPGAGFGTLIVLLGHCSTGGTMEGIQTEEMLATSMCWRIYLLSRSFFDSNTDPVPELLGGDPADPYTARRPPGMVSTDRMDW